MTSAFLFPGQGAESVGIGRDLAASCRRRNRSLIAREILGYDLAQICFEGPTEKLDSTAYSQPALFVTSLAALESLKQKSPEVVENCRCAAGLSLGEYTALVFAGVMEFEPALRVVAERGAAMQAAANATPSGMVSILGLEPEQLESLCRDCAQGENLQIANLLCPGNIVVSGTKRACRAHRRCGHRGGSDENDSAGRGRRFSHTDHATGRRSVGLGAGKVTLRKPRIPVVSNVDAKPHDDPEEIRSLLVEQVVKPVLWEDSVRCLLAQGVNQVYEVGPGRVLRGLMKRIDRKLDCQGVLE